MTKPGIRDFDELLDVLSELALDSFAVAPAAFTPTSRGRRYELLRPELDDLLQLAECALALSSIHREI